MFYRLITLTLLFSLAGCSPIAGRKDLRTAAHPESRIGKSSSKKSKDAAKAFEPLPQIVLIQPEWLEQPCVVSKRCDEPGQRCSYQGKLIQVDDQAIVLERPLVTNTHDKKPSFFAALFPGKASSSQQLEEDVSIARADVESIHISR